MFFLVVLCSATSCGYCKCGLLFPSKKFVLNDTQENGPISNLFVRSNICIYYMIRWNEREIIKKIINNSENIICSSVVPFVFLEARESWEYAHVGRADTSCAAFYLQRVGLWLSCLFYLFFVYCLTSATPTHTHTHHPPPLSLSPPWLAHCFT